LTKVPDEPPANAEIPETAFTRTMSLTESGAGIVIGPYHLLQRIGEGGMGEVWLAEQKQPVRRRVAVKLIKAGMDTREVVGRFASERQALALMDHPAIAKVLDAGSTPEGAPYFVMEYVAGVPITAYCDDHKLNTRERLELFMHVCDGVQHAHQKAIIHRDLKPSNILVTEVDGKPAPKIIDFGVAKALTQKLTADTMFTRVGVLVGTPEYMSPEQALSSGEDIDTRTDVYSLGIVFYELLAGAPPIELRKIAFDEFLRRLREDEPPKPSTNVRTQDPATSTEMARKRQTEPPALARQIRGDLDSIALKALEKDRSRRYGSPSDFAADIGRYLNNEAVLAVPPSVDYRARKFARRYRAPLATAVAFALVLIMAAVVSIRQSVHANREAAVAQVVNDFLQNDVLAQASVAAQSGLSVKPDPDLKVRTALDRAAARIAGKFDHEPEVEASIRDTIGKTYTSLGVYPEARKQLERALELRRNVLGMENPQTLETATNVGIVLSEQGKYAEAEALDSKTVEIQRRVLGPEHPDTLAGMNNLGWVYRGQGKYPQAEALLSQTLEISRRRLGAENPITLRAMNSLASTYSGQAKYAKAEALLNQTVEIARRVLGPEHPVTLRDLNSLAGVYNSQGKYADAEAIFNQVLEVRRRVLGPEHPDTLSAIGNLALVYVREGKYAEAEAGFSQVMEIQRRVLGPEDPGTLLTTSTLAEIYDRQGKYAQAEAGYSQAMEIGDRVLGPENPSTLLWTANLGFVLLQEGKYAQGESLIRKSFEIERRVLGPEHPSTISNMESLAEAYRDQGKYTQAEALYGQTLDVSRRVLGAEDPGTLYSLGGLGLTDYLQGKYAQAEPLYTQTLAGRRHALGPEDPDTLDTMGDLALTYLAQGKFAQSEVLAREAVEADRKKRPEDWQTFFAQSLLGASLAGQKKYAEAEPLLLEGYRGMEARKGRMAVPDRYHPDRAGEWIVQLYQAWGKPKKVAEWEQQRKQNKSAADLN
jgi:serine/threonine protein kinase/tetratricopeptide (TPR) repeat protein